MDQAGIGSCERLGPAIPLGHTLRSLMASPVPGASSHRKCFVSETAAANHQGHGHQSDVLDLKNLQQLSVACLWFLIMALDLPYHPLEMFIRGQIESSFH